MNKRYQVFISSTYQDLHSERQELIRALLELDCIPAGMELFPASDDDAWTLIKRVIDESDYYLVVSAGRYGSVHPDSGIGYTEMEYDYAVSQNKPVIGFLHKDLGSISADKSEKDPDLTAKLQAFHDKIKLRVVKHFNSPDLLAAVATRAIIQLIKQKPALGWIRAEQSVSPEIKAKISELELAIEQKNRELNKLRNEVRSAPQRQSSESNESNYVDFAFQKFSLEEKQSELIQEILDSLVSAKGRSNFVKFGTFVQAVSQVSGIPQDAIENIVFAMSEDGWFTIDSDDDIYVNQEFIRAYRLKKLGFLR